MKGECDDFTSHVQGMGFTEEVGIDLGTANVLIYVEGKGIVLQEPSVVAINRDTNEILAVGNEAKRMIGRTPGNISAIRPLKEGVISDYDVTERMLQYFIKKTCGGSKFIKPRIIVCVPSGVTEVEKRAVKEAALQAGGRSVYLIEEPVAAAIGAGMGIGIGAAGTFGSIAQQVFAPAQNGFAPQQSTNPIQNAPSGRFTQESAAPATPAGNAEDPMETLGKLKKLLDAGLIEQAEYDAKKAEILSRL